jgi:hypothetical protein
MSAPHQGKYKIKNPSKYKGDYRNIYYRSSWELRVFNYMDRNPEVVKWSSEEIVIPYRSPIDGKRHRYFPDVWMKTKNGDVYLIEIKPFKETIQPKKRSRITKQYLYEVKTWGINSAKWKSAKEYCADRNWKFKIITEKELGI